MWKTEMTDVASWQQSEATYVVGAAHRDGADALAIDLERKWGAGRLRLLVDVDLRARFDAQRLKFHRALIHGELEDVKRESLRMQNAWRALDAAAIVAGHKMLDPHVWEVVLPSGKVVAIVRSNEEQHAVMADGRKLDVYVLDEIANLLEAYPMLAKMVAVFPGAEVTRVGPITDPLRDWEDQIPW